jgi:hypothetical protein
VLAATLLTVATATLAAAPDLRVTDVEAQTRAGSPGELRVPTTVHNAGRRRAGASRTRYFLSQDRAKGGDVRLATARVAAIRAGRSRTGTAALHLPSGLKPGDWHVIACADALDTVHEGREGNNCAATRGAVDILPQTEPQIPPLP